MLTWYVVIPHIFIMFFQFLIQLILFQNGVIRGTLLAYQLMAKEKGGIILNIGSSCSAKPFLISPIYTATKHAILGLTKAYGDPYHYNLTGIRVIAYCVGPTESDSTSHRYNNTPNHERARKLDMAGVHFQKY